MNKAIFLDRDGVINELVFSKERNEYEPPHSVEDVKLIEGVTVTLKRLLENNFRLFIISNQPDFAKGKTTLENLINVSEKIRELMEEQKIIFTEYNYCYHHPDGIVKEYSGDCDCRKPKPFFILNAIKKYNLDKNSSWMTGDRDTDIQCGKNSGLKTILIEYAGSENYRMNSNPDFKVKNLSEAADIILNSK
ncbi:MAG: HAD family hydrolase [Ignavibacteria bacterium]|nr:HAD family hydrolase [Ignavibacteria bacterium]